MKPLYGHQEDAQVACNPSKPGRPSHGDHSYFIANLRMVMDVEVQAGNLEAVVECAAGDVGGCRTGMGGSGKCTAGDGMKQDSAAAAAQRCRGREDVRAIGLRIRHGGDHQHPCKGIADYRGIDAGERLSETNKGKCGAVDATRTMAPDPQRNVSSFSPR